MNLSPIEIDWTNATENLLTTGTGRFDDGVGVGIAAGLPSVFNVQSSQAGSLSINLVNTGAGDSQIYLFAGSAWSMGIDNSNSDIFKISQHADLETNTRFAITTAGDITSGNYNDATIAGSAGQVEFSSNSGANFWSSEGVNFIAGQADGFVLCGKASGATSRDLTVTGADITLDAATQTGWGTSLTHVTSNGTDHSLLGATAGTVSASLAVIVDANKDIDFVDGDITTTGWGRFDGGLAVGVAAAATKGLNISGDKTDSYTGINVSHNINPAAADKSLIGLAFTVRAKTSAENISALHGVFGTVGTLIAAGYTGTIADSAAFNATALFQGAGVNVTNAYLFRGIALSSLLATIDNAYGLYLPNITGGTTNWAIYSAGGDSSHAGDFRIGSNVAPTVALDVTGAALISTTLGVTGNFAVNTNKFTVTAASGNTLVAGTLDATGDFKVNTNKFTVAAASGNTLVAGTLGVTGVATFSDNVIINSDTASLQLGAGQDIYLYSDTDAELSIKGDDDTKDIKLLFESDNEGSITWMEDELRFDFDGHIQIQKDSGTAPFIKINSTLSGAGDQVYIETNYDSDGVPIRARLESKQGLAQVGTFTLHDLDVVTNSVTRMTVSAAGYVRVINRLKVGADSVPAQPLDVAGVSLLRDKLAFTQTDLNEYIDSLADGYMDYGATTAHRFNTTVEIATKIKLTAIGGYAVKLTNETGGNTVAGQVVKADTATNDAVILTAADEFESLGVFLDSGVADASEAWVVVAGIADIAMEDNTTATRGNWVRTSVTEAGYADATNAAPPGAGITEIDRHLHEIGHCIETVTAGGGGTHILARCVIHFN